MDIQELGRKIEAMKTPDNRLTFWRTAFWISIALNAFMLGRHV